MARKPARILDMTPETPAPAAPPSLGRDELILIWEMFGPQSAQPVHVPLGKLDAVIPIIHNIRRWVQAQAAALAPPPG
jgi:hypothetical protein